MENQKKAFVKPEVETVKYEKEDIITTSGNGGDRYHDHRGWNRHW